MFNSRTYSISINAFLVHGSPCWMHSSLQLLTSKAKTNADCLAGCSCGSQTYISVVIWCLLPAQPEVLPHQCPRHTDPYGKERLQGSNSVSEELEPQKPDPQTALLSFSFVWFFALVWALCTLVTCVFHVCVQHKQNPCMVRGHYTQTCW